MNKTFINIVSWIGLILIHGANIPVLVPVLLGWSDSLPPIQMVIPVWLGLFFYLLRSIHIWDIVYLASNAIGFTLQTAMLITIMVKT